MPIITVWVVAAPILAFILLFKYIKSPEENKVKTYFLILYQGLKQKHFYWEFVNTARKVLIMITFPFQTSVRIFFSLLIITLFTRLQFQLRPYKQEALNFLEIVGSNAGLVLLTAGLVYSQNEDLATLDLLILIIIFIQRLL